MSSISFTSFSSSLSTMSSSLGDLLSSQGRLNCPFHAGKIIECFCWAHGIAFLITLLVCSFKFANTNSFNYRRSPDCCIPKTISSISTAPPRLKSKKNVTALYRQLYHQLQNPESFPGVAGQAWQSLLKFLDLTISNALTSRSESSCSGILTIEKYDVEALKALLSTLDTKTSALWTSYLSRRSSGGLRELLKTRSYAEHWLRLAAPVKFVDGAWLSRVHHADTPLNLRPITRVAWQILSEELGDGDLAKNHVKVYADLLQSVGIDVGTGDSAAFVDPTVNPGNEPRVWGAAVAQQAIGMFPKEMLPEILGFNLAYEAVSVETLICAHELKELKLDPMYFNLHITIDNSNSGHTAMALHAVVELMKSAQDHEEEDALWKRVQAGYILAHGLPVTPRPLSCAEEEMLEIFSNKCKAAVPAHQCSKTPIGGRKGMKLGDWMDPEVWEKRKYAFLEALAASSWVCPGFPGDSRLVKEVMWKGRMFGAFTIKEARVLERWIAEMDPGKWERDLEFARGNYQQSTGRNLEGLDVSQTAYEPTDLPNGSIVVRTIPEVLPKLAVQQSDSWKIVHIAMLPFQHYLSSSAKSATERGMVVLRILRTLNGLEEIDDAVAGMDEVDEPSGEGVVAIAASLRGRSLDCDLGKRWGWLQAVALTPEINFWFLCGVQFALAQILQSPENIGITDNEIGATLKAIGHKVGRELENLGFRQHVESQHGFWKALSTVDEVIARPL